MTDPEILVDEQDRELVDRNTWTPRRKTKGAGRTMTGSAPYLVRYERRDGKTVQLTLHREILGVTDPLVLVDHINGDTFDNRRSNLRTVTAEQSRANAGAMRGSRSRFRGVSWSEARQLWRARLRCRGVSISLGYFPTEEEAATAWNEEAARQWGKFARMNEIPA